MLLARNIGHFITYEKPRVVRRGRLSYDRLSGVRPLRLSETHPDIFHRLYHFDPWWTMRQATTIPDPVRQAIIETNLAGRRAGRLEIRDIVFRDDLARVTEVKIRAGLFRRVTHRRIDAMPEAQRRAFFPR